MLHAFAGRRMSTLSLLRRMLAASVLTLGLSCAHAQNFSFGVWGDVPYQKAGDAPKIPALIQSINHSNIAFSLYDGDIKDGSSPCTDQTFTEALQMFGQLNKPVVYVPGDNEWTDCHRLNNGSYDPLERLSYLRKTMFPTSASLGKRKLALAHQGEAGEKFYENTRFIHGRVVFVGLNMPGSNNNKIIDDRECSFHSARTAEQCEAANAEYLERDAANVDWMKQAFALARQRKAVGIVLVVQADPGFDLPETQGTDESTEPRFSGYKNFLKQLIEQTEPFGGQVLLVHGDTHFFKLDKPLYSPYRLLVNFSRLQTFGSPLVHWTKVSVNPASANVFTVEPVIVKH